MDTSNIIAYVFSSTKLRRGQNRFCLEARREGRGETERAEGGGEKWPKQCMHK
jgi:hypothetical protein